VKAAQQLGCTLVARGPSSVTLDWRARGAQELQLLGVHEFDSARKRMSVVVRSAEGKAWLLVKGADSSMFPSLLPPSYSKVGEKPRLKRAPGTAVRRPGRRPRKGPARRPSPRAATQRGTGPGRGVVERTRQHVESYSCQGLRTLVLGVKELAPEEMACWAAAYQRAQKGLGGLRATLLAELAVAVEQGLRCVGATGIEDQLQEGVPETLQLLAGAGIKVWMLDGGQAGDGRERRALLRLAGPGHGSGGAARPGPLRGGRLPGGPGQGPRSAGARARAAPGTPCAHPSRGSTKRYSRRGVPAKGRPGRGGASKRWAQDQPALNRPA